MSKVILVIITSLLVVAFLVFGEIMGLDRLDKRKCEVYGQETGKETKIRYGWPDTCYVKINGQWHDRKELRVQL